MNKLVKELKMYVTMYVGYSRDIIGIEVDDSVDEVVLHCNRLDALPVGDSLANE